MFDSNLNGIYALKGNDDEIIWGPDGRVTFVEMKVRRNKINLEKSKLI